MIRFTQGCIISTLLSWLVVRVAWGSNSNSWGCRKSALETWKKIKVQVGRIINESQVYIAMRVVLVHAYLYMYIFMYTCTCIFSCCRSPGLARKSWGSTLWRKHLSFCDWDHTWLVHERYWWAKTSSHVSSVYGENHFKISSLEFIMDMRVKKHTHEFGGNIVFTHLTGLKAVSRWKSCCKQENNYNNSQTLLDFKSFPIIIITHDNMSRSSENIQQAVIIHECSAISRIWQVCRCTIQAITDNVLQKCGTWFWMHNLYLVLFCLRTQWLPGPLVTLEWLWPAFVIKLSEIFK